MCSPARPVNANDKFQAGRDSLDYLLTADDKAKLARACSKLPAMHDGITVLQSSGKLIWRMVHNPGQRTACERHELCAILRGGVGKVEYKVGVRRINRTSDGWALRLEDGEMIRASILIGKSVSNSA